METATRASKYHLWPPRYQVGCLLFLVAWVNTGVRRNPHRSEPIHRNVSCVRIGQWELFMLCRGQKYLLRPRDRAVRLLSWILSDAEERMKQEVTTHEPALRKQTDFPVALRSTRKPVCCRRVHTCPLQPWFPGPFGGHPGNEVGARVK